MRPKDQGMMVTERTVGMPSSQKKGACLTAHAYVQKHQVQSGGSGAEGKTWARAFIVVFVGRNGQVKISRFKIGESE